MNQIENTAVADELITRYYIKGSQTNNYLMGNAYKELIDEGRITYQEQDGNLYFFIEEAGFYKLLYYLNKLNAKYDIQLPDPQVIELVYRGVNGLPAEVIEFWLNNGFSKHLDRENMSVVYRDVTLPIASSEVLISVASTSEEIDFSQMLFNKTLDKYTGDQLSNEELINFAKSGCLLCARLAKTNELCGALQFEIKNGVVWLGHVSVDENFRGKGVAGSLVNFYFEINHKDDSTRYQLWVINDNTQARSIYDKAGFRSINRFTSSLLKK